MYTIEVHDLRFVGRHGVYEEERTEGRRFAIDIRVEVPRNVAGRTDALPDTVDYRDLSRIALEVGTGPSIHLVEALGERICDRILDELPPVTRVWIQLRKFATGVPGDPAWVGIELSRSRE